MSPQTLTPVQQVSIIGTGCSFDFGMIVDLCAIVQPQDGSSIGEGPFFPLFYMPVFVRDPNHSFVRMPALGPALQLLKQNVSAVMEGLCRDHTPIVIGPAMNHLVQFFNELPLGSLAVLSDQFLQRVDVTFNGLFTWGDDGFERGGVCWFVHPE